VVNKPTFLGRTPIKLSRVTSSFGIASTLEEVNRALFVED